MPRQISDMRRHALCSAIQIWTACVPALTESSVMLPKHPCLHWPCCNAWRYRKPDCFRVIDEGDMQAAASLRSSSRSMRCELHPALHLLNVWDGEVQQTSGLQGQSAYRFAAWVTQGLAIRNVGNGRWMAVSRFCKLVKAWNLSIELPSDSWRQSHALHSPGEPAMEA